MSPKLDLVFAAAFYWGACKQIGCTFFCARSTLIGKVEKAREYIFVKAKFASTWYIKWIFKGKKDALCSRAYIFFFFFVHMRVYFVALYAISLDKIAEFKYMNTKFVWWKCGHHKALNMHLCRMRKTRADTRRNHKQWLNIVIERPKAFNLKLKIQYKTKNRVNAFFCY